MKTQVAKSNPHTHLGCFNASEALIFMLLSFPVQRKAGAPDSFSTKGESKQLVEKKGIAKAVSTVGCVAKRLDAAPACVQNVRRSMDGVSLLVEMRFPGETASDQ